MQEIITGAVSLGLLWAVMTIGVYISYSVLGMADMTAEGSITMGAAIAAKVIAGGGNPYTGLMLAILCGMAAGLVNGLLHTKLKIPSLLSGILTMTALFSINLRIMGKANISLLRMNTIYTPVAQLLGVSKGISVIIAGVLVCTAIIGLLYWFFGTEIGSAIRATGNNAHMVRAQGINTDTTIILGMMLSNALIALSGAMIGQSQNYADLQMGTGAIVIGLASLFIGEVLFGKRSFFIRLSSMVMGAIIYRLIIAFVLKLGMPADDLKLFTAVTVILALTLPNIKKMAASRRRMLPGGQ